MYTNYAVVHVYTHNTQRRHDNIVQAAFVRRRRTRGPAVYIIAVKVRGEWDRKRKNIDLKSVMYTYQTERYCCLEVVYNCWPFRYPIISRLKNGFITRFTAIRVKVICF